MLIKSSASLINYFHKKPILNLIDNSNAIINFFTKTSINYQSLSFKLVVLSLIVFLAGCASTLRGAPKTFLSKNKLLTKHADIKTLINSTSMHKRNSSINVFLAEIDLRYEPFRLQLTQNDNNTNAFTDALVLVSSLAGTLTDSAGVKSNYLTLSALATGVHSIYDNRYLYTQSIFALIKGMDAARTQKLVEINTRMNLEINQYNGHAALTDIMQYSYSGTLPGSLNWIQSNATAAETKNMMKLEKLTVPTLVQFNENKDINGKFITAITKLDDTAITNILSQLPDGIKWDNAKDAKSELSNVFRTLMNVKDLPVKSIRKILTDAGMTL